MIRKNLVVCDLQEKINYPYVGIDERKGLILRKPLYVAAGQRCFPTTGSDVLIDFRVLHSACLFFFFLELCSFENFDSNKR